MLPPSLAAGRDLDVVVDIDATLVQVPSDKESACSACSGSPGRSLRNAAAGCTTGAGLYRPPGSAGSWRWSHS
jgi:hypothetical protein